MSDEKKTVTEEKVTLKCKAKKDGKETEKTREFGIKQANALLTQRKKRWTLSDAKYDFNGKELVKKSK